MPPGMTEFTFILFSIIMTLQAYYLDKESGEGRSIRALDIAEAIDESTDALMCVGDYKEEGCIPKWTGPRLPFMVMSLNLAWHESALARHIHEDKCNLKLGECDSGRAKGLWQVQKTPLVSRDTWWKMSGSSYVATFTSAWAAGTILARAYNGCRSWEGAVASYATGRGCTWEGSAKRVMQYQRLMARAAKAQKAWPTSIYNPANKRSN
jgi:hypothetical protein